MKVGISCYELQEVIKNTLHQLLSVYEKEIYNLRCLLQEKDKEIEFLKTQLIKEG